MHRGWINEFREVLFTGFSSLRSYSATRLLFKVGQRCTLDVSKMADSNNNWIVRIEILRIELMFIRNNLCATIVAIFFFYFKKFILHNFLTAFRIVENILQILYGLHQLVIFLMQLIHPQSCELRQTHVNYGLRLKLIQIKTFLKVGLSVCRCLAGTDNMNNLIDIVTGNNQPFQYMGTLLRFIQIKLCTTNCHVMTMLYKIFNAFLQAQQTWTPFHQRNTIHRERALQGCHLEEFVQNNIGISVTLYVNDNTHSLTTCFVIDIRNTL